MKKLLELLLKLLGLKRVEEKEVETPVIVPTEPTKPIAPQPELEEPAVSQIDGTITSFLWKPESDTYPKVSVVTVSSDTLRAEDVRIQITDKDGKVLKLNEKYNVGGVLRGNRLPNHKYGRFNFKPGPKQEDFAKLAPLKVAFFLELSGVRYPIKVMGKNQIQIKKPKERLDLK